VDLLESGSERPSRLASAAQRVPARVAAAGVARVAAAVPARVVAAGVAIALAGGLLAAGQVQRELREADDVSGVAVELVVERTTRAGDGSTYGFGRLEVVDPAGRPVMLLDVDVDVPGLRFGRQGLGVEDLAPAARLVLPLRFAVPDCAELELPGRLSVRVARPERPAGTVHADLAAAAVLLRRACGLPQESGGGG
jgi:hypothetical protein